MNLKKLLCLVMALLLATGAMAGVGWFAVAEPTVRPGLGRCAFLGRGDLMAPDGLGSEGGEGWTLSLPLSLKRGERRELRLALGWSEDVQLARARIEVWRGERDEPAAARPMLKIETPDAALNALANGFLLHQVRASRVLGRTGLYQPGGAWGFRDQLQDMLALLHSEPERVRAHLLRCAARQFEAGDVLHWWHEPCRGVRTRVSDDLLFLPWVTAGVTALFMEDTREGLLIGAMDFDVWKNAIACPGMDARTLEARCGQGACGEDSHDFNLHGTVEGFAGCL